MSDATHWNRIYASRAMESVSWYRPHLDLSLALIEELLPDRGAGLLDVGGGRSTLVDDLLGAGYSAIQVLDIADVALAATRARLGPRASEVTWHVGDVTTYPLPAQSIDLWHDRAVFHFLTDADSRARYMAQVHRVLRPRGHFIVATFASDGPDLCSDLPVMRYDQAGLQAALGEGLRWQRSLTEIHYTPKGAPQPFVYGICERIP